MQINQTILDAYKKQSVFSLADAVDHKEVKGSSRVNSSAIAYGSTVGEKVGHTSQVYDRSTLMEEALKDTGIMSMSELEKNTMLRTMEITSTDLIQKMKDDGYDPLSMEHETYVTVADQIRAQLAIAGADVSMMGGVSEAALESVTGSSAAAKQIERGITNTAGSQDQGIEAALNQALLPTDAKAINQVRVAIDKGQEILQDMENRGGIAPAAANLLLSQNREPTIQNLYQATYGSNGQGNAKDSAQSLSEAIQSARLDSSLGITEAALENRVAELNVDQSKENLQVATYLLSSDLPVTKDTILLANGLQNDPIDHTKDQLLKQVITTMTEGGQPGDTPLIKGYALDEKAEQISTEIQKMEPSNSEEKALLAEAQLVMTKDSIYTMLKLGIHIDTDHLEQVVDKARKIQGLQLINDKVQDVLDKKDAVLDKPAAVLAQFTQIRTVTFQSLLDASPGNLVGIQASDQVPVHSRSNGATAVSTMNNQARLSRMTKTYEAVGTEVRRDLGDSIKKAFRNVPEILKDLGFDTSEESQRAVRILGYNGMEIKAESIAQVKDCDFYVNQTMAKLKPGTVFEMIRHGENPLDMTMKELSDTADQYNGNQWNHQEQESNSYGEFLWELEQTDGITEEERQSFIGIYRLLHQVNKKDGAALGKLIQSQVPVTMRNLMTAVRTEKAKNLDYVIDDTTGMLTELSGKKLSITEQIETAFQSAHLKHAEEELHPNKLQEIGQENYIEMTPEQLDQALSNIDQSKDIRAKQAEIMEQQQSQAASAEDETFCLLKAMDLPQTTENILMAQDILKRRNHVFTGLTERHENLDGTIVDVSDPEITSMLEELMESYGEAVKEPADMAIAQEKLADLAETAMEKLEDSDQANAIDLKSLHLIHKELSLFAKMAREDHTYHIPVQIMGEDGNLTLKIVNGKEEKGQLNLALETSQLGAIRGHFEFHGEKGVGRIQTERRSTAELFQEESHVFSDLLSEKTDMPVEISVRWSESVETESIYFMNPGSEVATEDTSSISTKRLYGAAQALIQGFGLLNKESR